MRLSRDLFQEIIQTRAWADFQRPVVMTCGFIVLVVFVYFIILRPQIIGYQLAREEHKQVMRTFERYRDFGRFVKKINKQREALLEQEKNIHVESAVAEKTEQRFFEIIADIGDKAGIYIKKTTPTTMPDGRKAWIISFSADYSQVDRVLFLVEKMFVIEALSVVSGQPSAKHAVEMTIADLFKSGTIDAAHNEVIERYTGEDIAVMYDEVDRLLDAVEKRRKIVDAYAPPSRDLMLYADTLLQPSRSPRQETDRVRVEAPPIRIEGIFWDPEVPVVVINGKAMRTGDSVQGAKIVSIQEKNITVKYHDKIFTVAP